MGSHVTKSFIWSFLEQAGSRLAAMIVEIVLARLLVPEMFGIMAILLVLVNVADVVAQSGLGVALIQRQDTTPLSYSTAFWMSEGIALVLYMLIVVAAPLFAAFYEMDQLTLLLRVLAIVLFFKAYNSIQRSFLQKQMNFRALFISNTISVVAAGLCGVLLAYFGFGIWALIVQSLAQGALICLIMFIQIPWKPSICFSKKEAARLFNYGWKICISGIFGRLYTGLSDLIIGKACTATDLGYYSNGSKWPIAAMAAISNALENVFFPVFSSISSDTEALRNAVRRAISVGTFLMVFISFFLIVAAEPLIRILLTEKWLPSVPIFQLVCFALSFNLLQIVNLRAYMSLGDSGLYMRLQIIKVSLGICAIASTAVVTRNIYLIAVSYTIISIVNILVVDLQPSKRMLGIGRWSQIKAVLPCYVLGACSLLLSYPICFLTLPDAVIVVFQFVVYSFLYFVISRTAKMSAYFELVNTAKALILERRDGRAR